MDQTGSLVELLAASSASDWRNKARVEKTHPFQNYAKGLADTLNILKLANKSKNIGLLINAENALVELEKAVHSDKDPSVQSTLNAATVDLSVITKSIGVVRSAEYYQQVDTTIHPKKKIHGVPTDGCHEALNGHVTRLSNRMSAVGISIPEKNVLRQRQANMRTAKELYIGLQAQALGIELPSKNKGLER